MTTIAQLAENRSPTLAEVRAISNYQDLVCKYLNEENGEQLAIRKFMESSDALNVWIEQIDGTFNRGIPSKIPYEVRNGEIIPESISYWMHYDYDAYAMQILRK